MTSHLPVGNVHRRRNNCRVSLMVLPNAITIGGFVRRFEEELQSFETVVLRNNSVEGRKRNSPKIQRGSDLCRVCNFLSFLTLYLARLHMATYLFYSICLTPDEFTCQVESSPKLAVWRVNQGRHLVQITWKFIAWDNCAHAKTIGRPRLSGLRILGKT